MAFDMHYNITQVTLRTEASEKNEKGSYQGVESYIQIPWKRTISHQAPYIPGGR